ncbi:hypothetical protein WMY93_002488 [Mugilogobius chulae]|uniref:Uncharacterized protein n=1 Tax=Mugilogobius chulae TaxID=88201 RepID=A0AAW0Q4L2_9GOBI
MKGYANATTDASAFPNSSPANVQEIASSQNSALLANMHDYLGAQLPTGPSQEPESISLFPPLPLSPAAASPEAAASPAASSLGTPTSAGISPAPKQMRFENTIPPDITTTMLSEFNALKLLLNERADTTQSLITKNSVAIAEVRAEVQENTNQLNALKLTLDQTCGELLLLKDRVVDLETQSSAVTKTVAVHASRLSLLESYSRRWNLILRGLEEKNQQDVRGEAIRVLQRVLPEARDLLPDAVDTVHRLGPRRPDTTRGVIIQFARRHLRDEIWRAAKNSVFLKTNNMKLAEDLTAEDREKRRRLWPLIEKARKENKLAFFRGSRAFVDGTEIFPP